MRCLKNFTLIIALALTCSDCRAQLPEAGDLPGYLQDISVTVKASRGEGSGVAFCRDGVTYIWTAAHVVDDLRSTRSVTDPVTGTSRRVIEFRDASIVKQLRENGRIVGRTEMDAEVIRYSNADTGHDLALLRVRKTGFLKTSCVFAESGLVPLGEDLVHVGSLLGQMGANSMTKGIMSQHGRLIGKTVYDQTTVTAFPGSSGGGVFTESGRYVGMLVRGAGEGFNLIVPARRLRDWASSAGVLWAVNPDVPIPDDIDEMPVEDIGKGWKSLSDESAEKQFPFLLKIIKDRELPFSCCDEACQCGCLLTNDCRCRREHLFRTIGD